MRTLIHRWIRLSPVLCDVQCSRCGDWYDPSCPASSYPHNNHDFS